MVEQVTITAEEKTADLEAEAKALDAAKEKPEEPKLAGEEDTPDRPEWLPEKFKSPEDMAKAYAELEKAQSSKDPADTAEADKAAEEAVEKAGLDMDALSAEYADKGELSEDSLKKLAEVGITPEMVDAYVAGQNAQADALRADLLESVNGSQEAYDEMTAWASENLDDAFAESYNEVLESGNQAAIKLAIADLATKYNEANGVDPQRTLTGKAANTSGGVYESTADLMKDMQNPEYAENPAFRKKVEAKLARSAIL